MDIVKQPPTFAREQHPPFTEAARDCKSNMALCDLLAHTIADNNLQIYLEKQASWSRAKPRIAWSVALKVIQLSHWCRSAFLPDALNTTVAVLEVALNNLI